MADSPIGEGPQAAQSEDCEQPPKTTTQPSGGGMIRVGRGAVHGGSVAQGLSDPADETFSPRPGRENRFLLSIRRALLMDLKRSASLISAPVMGAFTSLIQA